MEEGKKKKGKSQEGGKEDRGEGGGPGSHHAMVLLGVMSSVPDTRKHTPSTVSTLTQSRTFMQCSGQCELV